MSTLRAILELQGSLDTAVIRSPDARVAEIADQFLPGTSENTEWYREIEAFMFPGDARTEADPNNALAVFLSTSAERPPTIPEMSRLMYGLGAVIHLTKNVPPGVTLPWADPTEGVARESLIDLLLFAGPAGPADQADQDSVEPRTHIDQTLDDVVNLFATQLNGWQNWYQVANVLASDEFKILTPEVASVPLCQAVVVSVNGIESVVVDTEFGSDDVTLEGLKDVVDPRNWSSNFPSFFCKMEYGGLRPDNWRRVLETVGICSIDERLSRRLRTMLKFHKSSIDGPERYEARLDYDLNDPVPDRRGDGQITVDRGFINMWSTNPLGPTYNGVRVRTRKVAHINGLRPYTMKRFVCIFGYGNAAMEMLFGSARDPGAYQPLKPWLDSPEIPRDPLPFPPQDPAYEPAQGDTTPPHPDNSVASTTITMVAKCVEDLTAKQFDLADRWMSGQLTVAELAQHSAEVGARIASEPWRIVQAISKGKGG